MEHLPTLTLFAARSTLAEGDVPPSGLVDLGDLTDEEIIAALTFDDDADARCRGSAGEAFGGAVA
jgi:hypothetical protein